MRNGIHQKASLLVDMKLTKKVPAHFFRYVQRDKCFKKRV